MEWIAVLVIAAAVMGICYLIDKGFTKLFRSQAQHRSGLAVRLSKRYGSIGLLLAVLGLSAVFMGMNVGEWLLSCGGGVLVVIGVCLVVYYMTFGIFYDTDGFLLMTFGKKSISYAYSNIQSQQLYNNQGQVLIELFLSDGNVVQLQSTMTGVYPFLDYAFEAWCMQTGRNKEDCPFYDPSNSCWFPMVEV